MFEYWKSKIFIPLVLAVFLANVVLPTKEYTSLEKANNFTIIGLHARASKIYFKLLETDPSNIELHRNRIRSYLKSDRDDDYIEVKNYYLALSSNKDKSNVNIALYGLGFIEVLQKNDDKALNYYFKVDESEMPYLNSSIGFIYLNKKKYDLAEEYFLKEIELEGNIKRAYSNLSKVYYQSGNQTELQKLINNEEIFPYLSHKVVRNHFLKTGQYRQYSEIGFKLGNFTTLGLIGAFLILMVWLIFLRKVDVFEPENPLYILITLIIACFFTMLARPVYDLFYVYLDFKLTGNYINDFLFCIFGIGLIEETVKIIPFLIIFRFKRIVNESVDYIIYSSVCGLGFAFIENILYFHPGGLDDMVHRMLTSVVLHMALTSFVAFGLLCADYKKNGSRIKYFTMAFLTACVVHGVYDFWLISDGWIGELKILSIGVLFYAVLSYSIIIVNALNYSEFYTPKIKLIKTFEFLVLSATMIAIYQYFVISYKYGVLAGNINLLELFLFSFIAFYIVAILGAFQLSKLEWRNAIDYYPDDKKEVE